MREQTRILICEKYKCVLMKKKNNHKTRASRCLAYIIYLLYVCIILERISPLWPKLGLGQFLSNTPLYLSFQTSIPVQYLFVVNRA